MSKNIGSVPNPVVKSNKHRLTQSYKEGKHNGIDLTANGKADYIISIGSGEITYTGFSTSRGYYVEIKHSKTYTSRYLHLKKGSITVKKGQKVSKGQVIGYMGSTGDSTGVHLHLAIIKNGTFVNPLPYVKGEEKLEKTTSKNTSKNMYQSYDMSLGKWLPSVEVNSNDYAGIIGHNLSAIYLDKGAMRVHTLNGKWLPEVNNRNDYAGIKTKKVDAVMVKINGLNIKYRVHRKGRGWLPYVSGYDINNSNSGYAGIIGQEIDAIQIMLK